MYEELLREIKDLRRDVEKLKCFDVPKYPQGWDDLRIEPVARTTGNNAPVFEQWYSSGAGSRGVYLYSFDDAAAASQKEVFFTMQMPHNWLLGTDINMHVHWVGAVADVAAAPLWRIEYVWKDIGQVYGNTASPLSDGLNYTNIGNDVDIVANKHYISKFAAWSPGATADGLSSIIIGRLVRLSDNVSDTYNAAGAKCGLLYIDAHYQIDGFGSSQEYVK